jgi:hypothetical protein
MKATNICLLISMAFDGRLKTLDEKCSVEMVAQKLMLGEKSGSKIQDP